MTHRSPITIRFADIDVMGHVNNTVYLHYFEEARIAWFRELVGQEWDWHNAGVILARNEIDYVRPLLFNDQGEVEVTVREIGTKSLTLTYRVFRVVDGVDQLVATGGSVLVCFDHKTQKTVPVPELWRERLVTEQ